MTSRSSTSFVRHTLRERIVILDGAMSTLLRSLGYDEPEERLVLTRPEAILDVHRRYIAAGADIIGTASFGTSPCVARAAATLARRAADETVDRQVAVAGCVGPAMPGVAAGTDHYYKKITALLEGGVDLLLLETIYDATDGREAAGAGRRAVADSGRDVAVAVSVAVGDDGLMPAGGDIAAFFDSIREYEPDIVMLNCGEPSLLAAAVNLLQDYPAAVGIYPSAGLPDALGRYHIDHDDMAAALRAVVEERKVNIIGGCCGTSPAHIRALSELSKGKQPRFIPHGGERHGDAGQTSTRGAQPYKDGKTGIPR